MQLTLGEKIKLLRGRADVSQDAVAALSGITRDTIGRIETDKISPRVDQLEAIAKALGGRLVVEIELELEGAA